MAINPHERIYKLTEEELEAAQSPEELLKKMEKIDKANENAKALAFIGPENEADKEALRENYKASLDSLEIEISALDALSEQLFLNPDLIQISIYSAKIDDIKDQIESLDNVCKGRGESDLDNRLDEYKIRFEEHAMVDVAKLKQRA